MSKFAYTCSQVYTYMYAHMYVTTYVCMYTHTTASRNAQRTKVEFTVELRQLCHCSASATICLWTFSR